MPSSASDGMRPENVVVRWTTSDSHVAYVRETGVLVPTGPGTVVVEAVSGLPVPQKAVKSGRKREEESGEEAGKPEQEELTREQRRELAKKRKAAAIAKKSQKTPEAGDMPTNSSEDEDDDMPANPNHTAKARTQATKAPVDPEAEPVAKGKGKQQDLSQLSRREREALQAQANKDRYDKLHAEGKTEQARADLERLKLVRERRDAEAARKKAEAEERAELEKEKKELMERENRRREQAKGKAERLAKGGKKKA